MGFDNKHSFPVFRSITIVALILMFFTLLLQTVQIHDQIDSVIKRIDQQDEQLQKLESVIDNQINILESQRGAQ